MPAKAKTAGLLSSTPMVLAKSLLTNAPTNRRVSSNQAQQQTPTVKKLKFYSAMRGLGKRSAIKNVLGPDVSPDRLGMGFKGMLDRARRRNSFDHSEGGRESRPTPMGLESLIQSMSPRGSGRTGVTGLAPGTMAIPEEVEVNKYAGIGKSAVKLLSLIPPETRVRLAATLVQQAKPGSKVRTALKILPKGTDGLVRRTAKNFALKSFRKGFVAGLVGKKKLLPGNILNPVHRKGVKAGKKVKATLTTWGKESAIGAAQVQLGRMMLAAAAGGFGAHVLEDRPKRPRKVKTAEEEKHGTGIPSMKAWFKPYPHQKRAIDRMYENGGKLILSHSTGSGKTASAIYGAERLRHDGKSKGALVIVPSGLRHNFAKGGVAKFTTADYQIVGSKAEARKDPDVVYTDAIQPGKPFTVISYALFRRNPIEIMRRTGADTIICDEFHATRNDQAQTFRAVREARKGAKNFMGLTASLINNSPAELAVLLELSEGRKILTKNEFRRRYIKTVGYERGFDKRPKAKKGLIKLDELISGVYGKLDHLDTRDLKGAVMPRRDLETVKVPMSSDQYDLYQYALDKLPALKKFLMKRDTDVSVKEAEFLFAQLAEARKISNNVAAGRQGISLAESSERTPKANRLLDDAVAHLKEDPKNKVVLYSNLVRGGADVLSAGMKKRGFDPGLFVGKGTDIGGRKVTALSRQKDIEEYKAGKRRVVILSSAGAEGLDLKDSTAFFSLDGHFNPERVLQAEARARRLGGQAYRPEAERVVKIRRYQNEVPESAKPGVIGKLFGKKTPLTTDEWADAVARRKHDQSKQLYTALRQPHKYIRRYKTAKGWRYVYPEDTTPTSGSVTSLKPPAAPKMDKPWYKKIFN